MSDIMGIRTLLAVVFIFSVSTAQLTTKCPNNDWSHYKERCYLVVNYRHSWETANAYCNKYGARLAEPTGFTITDKLTNDVSTAVGSASNYWIGYNTLNNNDQDASVGYWSDEEVTSVDVGVWGLGEPDLSAGDCAYVEGTRGQWFMTSYDRSMPFVCEMDPCPTDTFMCNGRCINGALVCDGKDDCGNGLDEQDCSDSCTYTQDGDSGTVTLATSGGRYANNAVCLWTLNTSPGKRINLIQFDYFETEAGTDVLEVFDGGPTLSTSALVARLSGDLPAAYTLTSSYNHLLLRFVSDGETALTGFQLKWSTEYACTYERLPGKVHTSPVTVYKTVTVTSKLTTDECIEQCDGDDICYGFSYIDTADVRECRMVNALPVLRDDDTSEFFVNMCPATTTIVGSVPVFSGLPPADTTVQQLSTPRYPLTYPGNQQLDYFVTAEGNYLITLEVTAVDLCCGDTVDIYDGTLGSHTLLERLGSDSTPHIIVSTGPRVYIRMSLHSHRKCGGVLINYKKGCDIVLTGTGQFQSPGFGTAGSYPGVATCTWTLLAPSQDRSISLHFDSFDLEMGKDFLTIVGSEEEQFYTGTTLPAPPPSIATIVVTMETSAITSGTGFTASFSPGCPGLATQGMLASIATSNYGDEVTVTCDNGYAFSGQYADSDSVTIRCTLGGGWDVPVPVCTQGMCGAPPNVDKGVIVSSTGTNGGETVAYTCIDGYDMTGNDAITCLASNDWTEPPTCTSIQCVDIGEEAATVVPTVMYRNGTNHGSVARLSCPQYQEIYGAATVQCSAGAWDYVDDGGEPSTCQFVPCETPILDNAYLSPAPAYYTSQEVTVTCKVGYVPVGEDNFLCGVTADLPSCTVMNCPNNITTIPNLVVEESDAEVLSFGDVVTVSCRQGYELVGIATSIMTVNCLADGTWSHYPTCQKEGCGLPQTVSGSVYDYEDDECADYDCRFSFSCKERYVLLGLSSQDDTTVRCGASDDGLWDFGDLRCTGGQCPDPGYPPSGRTVGESFAEDATVTFECKPGYSPSPVDRLTCRYNSNTGNMEWDGDTPTCVDTEPPVIRNCPDGNVALHNLESPLFPEPYAEDNNAVKEWLVVPDNYRPSMPTDTATQIYYKATDYNGNTATCRFFIVIPSHLECLNEQTTDITLSEVTTYDEADMEAMFDEADMEAMFMVIKGSTKNVTYTPPSLTLQQTPEDVRAIHAVRVDAYDIETNELLDSCTLQFRITAPPCAYWALDIPNGDTSSCSGLVCPVFCNDGHYFMENPRATYIEMTCIYSDTNSGWDRPPPVCAAATDQYVIYKATYQFKYLIDGGVADKARCTDIYARELDSTIPTFIQALTEVCNQDATNLLTLVLAEDSPTYLYESSITRFRVNMELVMTLDDETVETALALKDQCSSRIQSAFGMDSIITSISTLSGSTSPVVCGAGTYDLNAATPSKGYDCEGFRRVYSAPQQRVCLDCPVGYSYDQVEDNCVPCPAGRYGLMGVRGAQCLDCPNNQNPGLTGRIGVEECNFADICPPGTFSKDGLSPCTACPKNFFNSLTGARTCTQCRTEKVTLNAGTTSSSDCLAKSELAAGDVTPCTPTSPCENGGACTFVLGDYKCTCPPGYTGSTCETLYNACSSNPCQNDEICHSDVDDPTYFQCSCNRIPNYELSGVYCEIDDGGCANVFCSNNGTCHNMLSNIRCKCPAYNGYTNDDSNSIGQCNTTMDPCVQFPCVEGTCVPHGHFYRSCNCYPGYTGTACSVDIDDCEPDPCENGAPCVDAVDGMTCNCTAGYHGDYCQFRAACDVACDVDVTSPCHTCDMANTEECVNVGETYECHCMSGYTGGSCQIEIDPCNSYPCKHGGSCNSSSDGTYTCDCREPWHGPTCDTETNTCQEDVTCLNGGQCFSTYTGTVCKCLDGYIGTTCTPYAVCDRVNPCVGTTTTCNFNNDEFGCTCTDGYTGEYCETQLPSCVSNLCQNQGTCSDVNGEIKCTCAEGFTGRFCESDADLCLSNANLCSSNQECVNVANGYYCRCIAGKRGASCNKAVGGDFDYVILPVSMCRDDVSVSTFGDGETPIDMLTVSFHTRYTHFHDPGTILNIYGSTTGENVVPEDPDFHLRVGYQQVDVKYTSANKRRRRRDVPTQVLDIPPTNYLNDGYWHDVTVTWSAVSGEITLYVDGDYVDQAAFSKDSPVASRGFLVFGEFDTVTGTTVPSASFAGRISRMYIIDTDLTDTQVKALVTTNVLPLGTARLLNEERTTMTQYVVDYNSEVTAGVCRSSADTACPGLFTARDPAIVTCPGDMSLVSADRESSPTIATPVYQDGRLEANIQSGATVLGWGVHGVIFALYDAEENVAICSYRLFNRPVPCSGPQSSTVTCEDVANGYRCQGVCPGNSALSGDVPRYQTCGTYGMWDEDTKQYEYIYPTCSAKTDLTYEATLSLELAVTPRCQTVKANYQNDLLQQLDTFNSDWNMALCGDSCFDVLRNKFECTEDGPGSLTIVFPYVSPTMTGPQGTLAVADVIKIAVMDENVFAWNDAVQPVLSSLDITVTPKCQDGYMESKDSCVRCGSGTFYEPTTASCERCEKGSYSAVVTAAVDSCTVCHQSQTTPGTGSTSEAHCLANCLRGQYYNNQGQVCSDCLEGFYNENSGAFSCIPCPVGTTTAAKQAYSLADCVPYTTLTTTSPGPNVTPAVGAATEGPGISVGAIVAIVLGVTLAVAMIILVICFCFCKEQVPCFAKKTTEVVPEEKDRYYVNKYGETHMRFVSYNLQDVRDKKPRTFRPPAYDKMPIVEPPLSDESGSVKTDISVHVPVFLEKLDGKVTRKSTYMSNGSARVAKTSSPRSSQYDRTPRGSQYDRTPRITLQYERDEEADHYEHLEAKKRRKKHRSHRKASRPVMPPDVTALPKALSPMPHRLRSMPPSETNIRPSSAMNEPRVAVLPSDYREFVGHPSARSRSSNFMSSSFDEGRPQLHYDQPQIQVESDEEDLR